MPNACYEWARLDFDEDFEGSLELISSKKPCVANQDLSMAVLSLFESGSKCLCMRR